MDRMKQHQNRYQIITYSEDSGADEKREYKTIKEAEQAAREYKYHSDGYYCGLIIFDLVKRVIVREWGYFSDRAKPVTVCG